MTSIQKLLDYSRLARKLTGKSLSRQLAEGVRLAMGGQRLGLMEYYELEIFNDAYFPPEDKHNCIGWRASAAIDKRLNHDSWRATANDKVLNYALLGHYGFPTPTTIATYSHRRRQVGKELLLCSLAELENYVTTLMPFPVFIKPIHGSYGRGAWLLISYDPTARQFTDVQGKSVPLVDLLNTCATPDFAGMLFQKCLEPNAQVERWVGSATSCVRVIVALSAEGAIVHSAFWKIARAHNITDNFHMGATGNLLAALDKRTGRVERVITGLWPDGRSITQHPDTREELIGRELPDWDLAMKMCLSAAVYFPLLRLQHWDVAFCASGPVLMELNTEADLGIPQLLACRPFLDTSIASMMKEH